jgi:hypothetical protein
MTDLPSYLWGLATLPIFVGALWLGVQLADTNCGIECGSCGAVFGRPGRNLKQATLMRWRWHYIKHRGWRSWTCERRGND